MNCQLLYCAVVTPESNEDFTLSASQFASMYMVGGFTGGQVEYRFESYQLDGKYIDEATGSYAECKAKWARVCGYPMPIEEVNHGG